MVVNSLPASTSLLAEINALAPTRDKASDGTVGDAAHQAEISDHNPDDTPGSRTPYSDSDTIAEVHARDVDSSGPWPRGWSMERIVQIIVARHRAGQDSRLQNIIYNRRIWSRSWGWTQETYTGSDPHTNHAHFSFRYGSGTGTTNPENDIRPWGITATVQEETRPMTTLDTADHAAIRNDAFLGAGYDIGQAFIRATSGNPADASGTDRAIRNGWSAGVSFAIETEYKAIMAAIQSVLTELTSQSNADNVITAINSARDSAVAEARTAFTAAVTEIEQSVSALPAAIVARLQDPSISDAQVAALLDQWLGARKTGVLAYLNS